MGRKRSSGDWSRCARAIRLPPEEAYSRVKGVGRLDRRALAVLRELVTLRDGIARRRDLPRYRVVRDDLLLSIWPRARHGGGWIWLESSGLPRSWRSGKRRTACASGRGSSGRWRIPEDELPESLRTGRRPERDPVLEARVRAVSGGRDRVGRRNSVSSPRCWPPGAVLEAGLQASRRERGSSRKCRSCGAGRRICWTPVFELARPRAPESFVFPGSSISYYPRSPRT